MALHRDARRGYSTSKAPSSGGGSPASRDLGQRRRGTESNFDVRLSLQRHFLKLSYNISCDLLDVAALIGLPGAMPQPSLSQAPAVLGLLPFILPVRSALWTERVVLVVAAVGLSAAQGLLLLAALLFSLITGRGGFQKLLYGTGEQAALSTTGRRIHMILGAQPAAHVDVVLLMQMGAWRTERRFLRHPPRRARTPRSPTVGSGLLLYN